MTTPEPSRATREGASRAHRLLFAAWVVVATLFVLFPIYLLVMVSVAPGSAIFGERPALFVTEPTLRFWARVIERGDLSWPLVKSLAVASATTLVAVAVAAPAAYVISRLPAGPRYAVVVGLLVPRMFPEFAIGVSVATRFAQLGLADGYLGLTLAHLIGSLPFIAWILVGTFEGVPRELEEAAAVDGASRFGVLGRIVAPAAAPGIAVAALFVWLYSWNEFLYARLLTTSQNTLPLQVFQAVDRGAKQQMAALAAALVVPVLPIVYVLQRYLRPGALAGAVKG
ncbi:MAG: carbohydrate ABC transporter permease [Candidatus Rokuibacteriota bacterium]